MPSLAQRAFAEWLETAFLLATVVGSGIMAAKLAGGNAALALLCNTLPTGCILAVLILIFGSVSGAHFNPAVSLAFALRGELPWPIAALYIAAQIAGAMVRRLGGASDVRVAAMAILDHRARRRRAMARRSRRHVRIAAHDLRLCSAKARRRCLRRRPLHHGSLLVYGLDILRQSSRDPGARAVRHIRRHRA